jgi:hypothetical protein
MASWRENASAQAQADLDELFETAVGFAKQQLEARGEFHPYAAVVRTDGETAFVDASLAVGTDHPSSVEIIAACREALAATRDELRAAAVVSDVRVVSAGGDAILVEVEHTEGPSIAIVQPYTKKRFGRGVQYGELQASTGTRHVWPD